MNACRHFLKTKYSARKFSLFLSFSVLRQRLINTIIISENVFDCETLVVFMHEMYVQLAGLNRCP